MEPRQTRSQTAQAAQFSQPPKQAAYAQASNPVEHTPQEQRTLGTQSHQYGEAEPSITRGASSRPSNDEARALLEQQQRQDKRAMQNHAVDLEYGVEQQPSEGYIADSVERKGMGQRRAQAGAHAGPVGSAGGPGHPGFGDQVDLAAGMDEKRAEHDRMLDERAGKGSVPMDHDVAEREAVRQRKLQQNENVDAKEAVKQATGDPVVGSH
ncbi:hypothetical protein N7448_004349 [Penicillium atrosanguineum]|uniref:Uncharacterized protein n=1 Tax=Penicillium atrosanguineum TaxID=1132637 RepID=A0A9W9L7Y4_9EURO|nr:Prolyl 3-4-dihydroxylase ofd1 [Penicillium atrosanguineum]KAJ5118005.1 hypothetical protein N7526_011028 [Penicillium atrosanguineum]KAJ5140941.1 hypothetical protein N7448_004349 [Penicillium atrosanguineum]KAJ5310850.1 Prolyl 3-4-dihydroxylase ofd1 [Penicillium atrosanguineum]KAJ5316376.1 hypothetical protein N7476_006683 [Penicillium atrosanguineum]